MSGSGKGAGHAVDAASSPGQDISPFFVADLSGAVDSIPAEVDVDQVQPDVPSPTYAPAHRAVDVDPKAGEPKGFQSSLSVHWSEDDAAFRREETRRRETNLKRWVTGTSRRNQSFIGDSETQKVSKVFFSHCWYGAL